MICFIFRYHHHHHFYSFFGKTLTEQAEYALMEVCWTQAFVLDTTCFWTQVKNSTTGIFKLWLPLAASGCGLRIGSSPTSKFLSHYMPNNQKNLE